MSVSPHAQDAQETADSYKLSGYYRKPYTLRQDCLALGKRSGDAFIFADWLAALSIGRRARWIAASYSDMKGGLCLPSGKRLPDTACGLSDNKSIKRAIEMLVEAGIIEVQARMGRTCYALHKRYWMQLPADSRMPVYDVLWLSRYDASKDVDAYMQDDCIMQSNSVSVARQKTQLDSIMQSDAVALSNQTSGVMQPGSSSIMQPDDIAPAHMPAGPAARSKDTSSKKHLEDTDKDTFGSAPIGAGAPNVAPVMEKQEQISESPGDVFHRTIEESRRRKDVSLEVKKDEETNSPEPVPSHSQATNDAQLTRQQADVTLQSERATQASERKTVPQAIIQVSRLTDDELRDKQAEIAGLQVYLKQLLTEEQNLIRQLHAAEMGHGRIGEAKAAKNANTLAQGRILKEIEDLRREIKPYLERQHSNIIPFPAIAGD